MIETHLPVRAPSAVGHHDDCIVIEQLTKRYRNGSVCALDALSVRIFTGEVFGLIGPNGAGKSTLLGCILGLLIPESGSVSILNKDASLLSTRQIMGYAPERPDFEGWMTAVQFLEYHHSLARQNARTRRDETEALLRLVGLSETVWRRRIGTFSRGMLQRLNIAQSLIGSPRILLLDEPTLGLDPAGVVDFRDVIMSMRKRGLTIVINSHQLDEIERVCDRVAFISAGKIRSIEHLGESDYYKIRVRWQPLSLVGSELLDDLARQANAVLEEFEEHQSSASFKVVRGHAYKLIRTLTGAGVPVEEAVPEKSKLERLFAHTGVAS